MKRFLRVLALFGLLMLAACRGGLEPNAVKMIDITEIVPIHVSTLDYFDYVITYQDNTGQEDVDVIRYSPMMSSTFMFHKTFSYKDPYVTCSATVELVPKVPESEVATFTFISPKPYLSARVIKSLDGVPDDSDAALPDGYGEVRIDSMEIGEFLQTYGQTFSSQCRVTEDSDGIVLGE